MNNIEKWARFELLKDYVGFGVLGIVILILIVLLIKYFIENRRKK